MSRFDFEKLNKALEQNSQRIEKALTEFFDKKKAEGSLDLIKKAQTYSVLDGGKRIRPFLVNEVCRMLGGTEATALPFAVAIEMIHTYSLIHDDLPCMDDDDMRRGRPTNHKVFGEANAVLAGDALLTNAFLAASSNIYASERSIIKAVNILSRAAGDEGMIGGQITDIAGEGKRLTFEELLTLHSLKTGKLIEASAALGCIAAGYEESTEQYKRVCAYARRIGLVFQVIDDLLDVVGEEKTVGKTLSSDAGNNKTTFLTFYDVDGARNYARELTEEAIKELESFPDSDILASLAQYLLIREK